MKNKKIFSYKSEFIKSCIYALLTVIFANLAFFSVPKEFNLSSIILIILLFILEILVLIFLSLYIIKINKRKTSFIKYNSKFEHILDNSVSKEYIIEKLKLYGYSLYNIDSSKVLINADIKKNKRTFDIYAYYFIIIDLDKENKEDILKKISSEIEEIFSLYMDDSKKIPEKETDKKLKVYNNAVLIICGNYIGEKILEDSKNGYAKLLDNNFETFVIAYSNNTLYFADAVERVMPMKKLPKRDFISIIKDIFNLK